MKTIDDYADLIERLEQLAARRPLVYKIRLFLLSLLGPAYMVFMLVLALVMSVGLLAAVVASKNFWLLKATFKFIWLPLLLAFVIFKGMWVRIPPPQGHEIRKKDVPLLMDEIKSVRRALKSKKIHRVLLTNEYNAGVTQIPRLGLLGWPRNYLIVGLPLMASLSPSAFRAVLAHEFGHLSARHARFGNWIYRIRRLWMLLLDNLERKHSKASAVFTWFYNRYAPYFNAYSFVLARRNEYQADAAATRVSGVVETGRALADTYAKSEFIHRFYWPNVLSQTDHVPHPPDDAYSGLAKTVKNIDPAVLIAHFRQAMQSSSDLHDTHPSLSERLAALQVRPAPSARMERSAGEVLLGEHFKAFLKSYDQQWKNEVAPGWRERFQFVQSKKQILEQYKGQSPSALNEDQLWDYAQALYELHGPEKALPLYQALIKRNSEHGHALFVIGRIMLEHGGEGGTQYIKKAMALEADLRMPGAQMLSQYYDHSGDEQRAGEYLEQYQQYENEQRRAEQERHQLSVRDTFETHDMPNSQLLYWCDVLTSHKQVKQAWLVKKRVAYRPDIPAYVLIVKMTRKSGDEVLQSLLNSLTYDGSLTVLDASKNKALVRKIRQVEQSDIFP